MPYTPNLPKVASRYEAAYADPQGEGDARPTALKIIEDEGFAGKLPEKVGLITGGTNGIGLEIVRTLAKTGMKVFFTTRDATKGQKVKQQLLNEDPNFKLEVVEMELKSLKSVAKGAEDFLIKSDRLDILMLNAGVGAVPREFTEDGFESQFAINYLSHFYLFQLVKHVLLDTASRHKVNVRVVATSSTSHTASTVLPENNYDSSNPQNRGYPDAGQTYGHTHTAKIWLCNEVERRYGSQGVHAISTHPGGFSSGLLASTEEKTREYLEKMIQMPHIRKVWMTLEQGAATNVMAAVGKEYDGLGGFYMENCGPSHSVPDEERWPGHGFKSWAFDKEGEQKLWADSLKMVGLEQDPNGRSNGHCNGA